MLINSDNVENILPLLPAQKSILYNMLSHPDSYNNYEQWRYKYQGYVNTDRMLKAWMITMQRYDVLRGVFRWEGLSQPVFIILKYQPWCGNIYHLEGYDNNTKQKQADDIALNEWKNRVDIKEKSIRLSITVLSDTACEWIITSNHILFDGWSNAIIMKFLLETYHLIINDEYNFCSNPLIKYNTYYAIIKNEADKKEHVAFWKDYLSGYKINMDKLTKFGGYKNKRFLYPIDETILKGISDLGVQSDCSFSAVLYCAWAVMLSVISKKDDILIAVTVSGRSILSERMINDTVGLLIHNVPLRVNCNLEEKLLDILKHIQKDLTEVERHVYVDPVNLNEILPNINVIFKQVLTIQNYPVELQKDKTCLELYSSYYETNVDILASIKVFMDNKYLEVVYNNNIYSIDEINKIFAMYIQILDKMIKNPMGSIYEIKSSLYETALIASSGEVNCELL